MIQAINLDENIEYVSKGDKDNPTVWLLKPLTIAEENFIAGLALRASRGKEQEMKMIEYAFMALHIGLIGAENFIRKDGMPAVFERDTLKPDVIAGVKPWTDKTLAQIPKKVRDELATVIITKEYLTEDEQKNS